MPGFFDVAHRQRAHRFLEVDPVSDDDIAKILDAAIRAPSAQNTQPWEFIVIRDADLRRQISEATRDAWVNFAREYSRPDVDTYQWADTDKWAMEAFGQAPVIILVCGDTNAMDEVRLGSSIFPAVQNILLGALELGLGSLLSTLPLFSAGLNEALGLPENLFPMAAIPIGQPSRKLGPPTRIAFEQKTHRDRYGQPWDGVMRVGVVFPQTEIGADVADVRAYAERVEALGFTHVLAYDHVLGADPAAHEGWQGPYNVHSTFHEPFVLFGYLAAVVSLELVTGVIILPQRQTALAAKQAAEVDLLTRGHFRLGLGLGWNAVEYEALGKNFTDRGRRLEEQIELMRRLWTEPSITFEGKYERVTGAGLAPLPVQRPIPIWIGGQTERAYRRIGRLADGWFPMVLPGARLDEARAVVEAAARDVGRDPTAMGMEGRVTWIDGELDTLVRHVGKWRDAGATHVSVNTMGAGLAKVDDHLAALAATADALGLTAS